MAAIFQVILFHRNTNNDYCGLVIPVSLIESIVDYVYSGLGHPGMENTNAYLKKFYYS